MKIIPETNYCMTDSDVKNNRNSFLTAPEENNIVKNFIKKRHFLPNRNTVVGFDGVVPVESKIKSLQLCL